MKQVKLVTDGACIGNPGPGGWAAILRYGKHMKEFSGGVPWTTNNRMEMTAVLEGLKALREPCAVTIELDSQYVKDGITRWIRNWTRRDWKTVSGDPVKNKDLWQEIQSAMSRHEVKWVWVKGHADHEDNNRCDRLAKKAAGLKPGKRKKKRKSRRSPKRGAAGPSSRAFRPRNARPGRA